MYPFYMLLIIIRLRARIFTSPRHAVRRPSRISCINIQFVLVMCAKLQKADPDPDSAPPPVRREEPAISEAPPHDEGAQPMLLYPNLSELSHQPPSNDAPAILPSPVALNTRSQVKGPTTLLPEGFRPTKSDREGTVHAMVNAPKLEVAKEGGPMLVHRPWTLEDIGSCMTHLLVLREVGGGKFGDELQKSCREFRPTTLFQSVVLVIHGELFF
ncbi:uncharacterized protein LOC128612521 isoform X2 [Ictalurus furcatus]|uniref:uncharacterized protein LOC128612521 isoform X2 n=1 Tax=Ictalurus furcatus TaxID=66913 RepID=UPI0023505868|nr:uncharacterized protein LOC128612521 isoform X2 [Ictalurus furcatus]